MTFRVIKNDSLVDGTKLDNLPANTNSELANKVNEAPIDGKKYGRKNGSWQEINESGSPTWGSITGTLSNQTDLQNALDGKVDENTPITGATKTKITYDEKGLVIDGADATTADIADSLNKRYVTDAQLSVIGNTSGTNTGDETEDSLLSKLTVFNDSKEITGFYDNDNIDVNYNQVNRTITLTHSSGLITYYWRGKKYTLTSPWISDAHLNTPGTSYFLKSTDGINFVWSSTAWVFSDIQVAYARYAPATAEYYCIRETHGFMQNESHREAHDNIGTYRVSGLDIVGGSVLIDPADGSATDAGNRPAVNAGVIKDEDNSTTIPATPDNGPYTTLYFDGSQNSVISTTNNDIYYSVSGRLQYNPVNTGLVDVTNSYYVNIWAFHVPVTSDTASQKYRTVWVTGQQEHQTLAAAQAVDPRSINWGSLTGLIPEQVPYAVVTMQYKSTITTPVGKCKIVGIRYLVGSRLTLISGSPSVTSHGALSGVLQAGTGVTDGHISDQSQTIYGIKTFNSFNITPSSAPTTDYQTANKKYVDDNAGKVGTKQVDEAAIANDKILVYKTASGKLEYEAKPTGGGASFDGIRGQSLYYAGEYPLSTTIWKLTAFASGTFAEMQISTATRTTGTTTVTVYKNGVSIGTATITSGTSATNGRYFGTSADLADSYVNGDVIAVVVTDDGAPQGTDLIVNFK